METIESTYQTTRQGGFICAAYRMDGPNSIWTNGTEFYYQRDRRPRTILIDPSGRVCGSGPEGNWVEL